MTRSGGGVVRVELQAPHAGQAAIDDLFAGGARFVAVMCARQFGKTSDLVRRACVAALRGEAVGIFVPQLVYADEIWRDVTQALGPVTLRKNEQKRRLEVLVDGGVVEVWSFDSNEDAGRGRRYDWVFVDEAGLIGDLLNKWRLALRATLLAKQGRAVFYGTPKGAKSDFVQLYRAAESDETGLWRGLRRRTLDNPYIDPDEVERARREMPPEQFAQEFEAVPMDDGSTPLTVDVIAAAIGERSSHPTAVWGIDLARSGDWCWMIGLDEWGNWTESERWQAAWSVSKRKIANILKAKGGLAIVDATGIGDVIVDDLLNAGVERLERFVFTEAKRRHLIEGVIVGLHNKRHRIPGLEHGGQLKRELEALQVEWRNGKPFYEVPPSIHDDGLMALGLAIHGYTHGVPTPSWPLHVSETRPWRADIASEVVPMGAMAMSGDQPVEWAGLGEGW